MPRNTRRKVSKAVGPFDLSTRKLPGGTELEALETGYVRARERKAGYDLGYVEAVGVANDRMIRDTRSAYLLADITKPHGAIFRGVSLKDVLTEYKADIEASVGHAIPTTDSTQRKMMDKAMGVSRGQKTSEGLPAEFRFVIKPGVSITHVSPAKKFLIEQDQLAMNAYVAGLLVP